MFVTLEGENMPKISKGEARKLTIAASRKMVKVAQDTRDLSQADYKAAMKLAEDLRKLMSQRLR